MVDCAADHVPGTLTPDSADEATTLIPSLAGKMDNETLQPILDELTKMREWDRVVGGDANDKDKVK